VSEPVRIYTEKDTALDLVCAIKAKQDSLEKKQRDFKLEQEALAWTEETRETRKEGL
jgi:hypothetical protein